MKNMNSKIILAGLLATALPLVNILAGTDNEAQIKAFKNSFSRVPAPEIAAQAATLVKTAKADDQTAAAISAVQAAMQVNPASTIAVVGAIARVAPATAPSVAKTAAFASPKSASAIAKAAAAAAPDYADKIVYAICKELPKQYSEVALAVSQAVPEASKKILAALVEAIPSLKSSLESASKSATGPSETLVASVLGQLSQTPQAPPTKGPPFVPGSGKPGEIKRTNTVIVTSGPRNYSRP